MKNIEQKISFQNADPENNTTDTQSKKPKLKIKISTKDTTRDAPMPCQGPIIA